MNTEDRVTKLEEQMLVQAELVTWFERRVDRFMERTDEGMYSAKTRLARRDVLTMAILERMDRFSRRGKSATDMANKPKQPRVPQWPPRGPTRGPPPA